jgi:hypothetical protein
VVFKNETTEADNNGNDQKTNWQSEINSERNEIQKQFGWHFLAKEVADFTNVSFFDVMDRSAREILGIIMIIQAKIKYNSMNATKQKTS